ncbi:hypothetical protein OOJ96_15710 [Pseudomonas sp. 15FMM2]|uniref:Uncharacterized protein n=1 Tax=Pseudomonas imrae TaxID=2992837 RepID=A0ACC7PHU2_9PSED
MKKTLALLSILFTLSACEDTKKVDEKAVNATEQKSNLILKDGTPINLTGTIVKTTTKKDGAIEVITHTVKFDSGSKIAENSVYSILSKQGYTRKVIESTDEKFKVHYYKKDQPTIGSVYLEKSDQAGQSSVLSIYWRII